MLSALSVISPAALWALLALAIPLLIHLFSRSRGRLVHIGHIDLIRQARKLQVTEIRLTQWLLLLLRLGIFALAALILAGLATTGLDSSNANTVYLTPGWLQTSSSEDLKTVMDAAEADPGSRVLLLQPGFPKLDGLTAETTGQALIAATGDTGNTWSLLAERLSLERHLGEVTVYATDRLLQFGYNQPALPHDVQWHVSHPPPAAVPRQKPIRVLIAYDPDRIADVPAFTAALTALKKHRLPGLVWESIESGQSTAPTTGADWFIHLGSGAPDFTQAAPAGSSSALLADAADDGAATTNEFISLPFYPFSSFRLERYNPSPGPMAGTDGLTAGQVLLATADGRPLLQEFHAGQTRVLRFHSRFNPNWSSLVQQPEFPEILLQLMLDPDHDLQRFADARVSPANLPAARFKPAADITLPRRSVQRILAILLLILWVSERWLSESKRREKR